MKMEMEMEICAVKVKTPSVKVKLLNGQLIAKEFYNDVLVHAGRGVMKMDKGRLYTAKELCGEEFWLSMNNWERRTAGRCFAHMVSNKVFDLQFIKYKKSPTKRYLMLDDI